jgi:hypothetical protein
MDVIAGWQNCRIPEGKVKGLPPSVFAIPSSCNPAMSPPLEHQATERRHSETQRLLEAV